MYDRELDFRREKKKKNYLIRIYWKWNTINFIIMQFMVFLVFNFHVILLVFFLFLIFFIFIIIIVFKLMLTPCSRWGLCFALFGQNTLGPP